MDPKLHLVAWLAAGTLVGCATARLDVARPATDCLPALRQMVAEQDFAGITGFKTDWEQGWSSEWVLTSAREEDIDHFTGGCVLKWVRVRGAEEVTRTDAFSLDGCFKWGAETVHQAGREVARGGVYITRAGVPKYREMVYVDGSRPDSTADLSLLLDSNDILYYELEALASGQITSVYRSRLNFLVDPETLEPDEVPADAQLVSGPPWPAIERARRPR